MGGDQEQDGFRRGQHIPQPSDQPLRELPSTAKLREDPAWNREHFDGHSAPSGSYFSTLKIPQSFSFVRSFQGTNNSFLADAQSRSYDRSLSSPVIGQQGLSPDSLSFIHDIPSCSSRLTQGETSEEMAGGSSLTKPRRTRMRSHQVNSSSLKRQKYLEKRRNIETCRSSPMPLGKRRSYSDDEDEGISMQPIRKVFINEDKMAARFDGLSLSHRFRSPDAEARRIMADIDSRLTDSEDEDEEVRPTVNSRGQRLEMSDSFKTALQKSSTKVLPDKIAQKIANPCTAMILWQPSTNDVILKVKKDKDDASQSQMMDDDDSSERPQLPRPTPYVGDPDDNMDL